MNKQIEIFLNSYKFSLEIILDFYKLLPEDKYSFRLVDNNNRKSDTPQESFAHILEVWQMYIEGIKTGKLSFKNSSFKNYYLMSKTELLSEADKLNSEFESYICSDKFDPNKIIDVPWGKSTVLSCLYSLREHLILHQGWNLALMDVLDIPRYKSLQNTWGQ